jgi:hypothetical protein
MAKKMIMLKLGIVLCLALGVLVLGGQQSPKSAKAESGSAFGRVKWKINSKWLTFDEVGQSARAALKQKNLFPPPNIKPVFDLFPGEKPFLRVMFPQGIGKECCYVEFDRNGKVLVASSAITEG